MVGGWFVGQIIALGEVFWLVGPQDSSGELVAFGFGFGSWFTDSFTEVSLKF